MIGLQHCQHYFKIRNMNEEMSNGQGNGIRPVKIRIVNPTPKSDLKNDAPNNKKQKTIISFLFFIMIGCLLFFVLNLFNLFLGNSNLTTWKIIILRGLFLLFFSLGLPIFFYFNYCSEIISHIHWMTKPSFVFLTVLLAMVSANVLTIINAFISLLLNKINFISTLWIEAPFISYLPKENLIYSFIFLLIFCLMPAFLEEFGLRQILLKRNLKTYNNFDLIFIQGLITALLGFNFQLFIPYLGFGMLSAFLFISFGNMTLNIIFHFSFKFIIFFILDKFNIFDSYSFSSGLLSNYFPLILNILLSLCILFPLLIIMGQLTKSNPVWKKDALMTKSKKKMQRERYFVPSFCILIILNILFLMFF